MKIKEKILEWIENISSKLNVWAWHKRWNKRGRRDEKDNTLNPRS